MPWSRLRANRPGDVTISRHSTINLQTSELYPNDDPTDSHTFAPPPEGLHTVRSSSPLRQSIEPERALDSPQLPDQTREQIRKPNLGLETLLHPPRKQRFSLLKLRHASDSQLSRTAKEHADASTPPMPSTPAIITTAPTSDAAGPEHKRKSTFTLPRRRKAADALRTLSTRPSNSSLSGRNSTRGQDESRLPSRMSSARQSQLGLHDPEKKLVHGAPPPYGEHASSALALPVSRLSESSRSDGSDHGLYATTTTTHTVSTTTTFFKLPRRKKNKGPLFPLPVRVPPPEPSAGPSASHSVRMSARSSMSPKRQSLSNEPPLTAINRSYVGGLPSPLPSPNATVTGASVRFPVQGTASPRDSTSAPSSNSSPIVGPSATQGRRTRASTRGSLRHNIEDDYYYSPPTLQSGRTSSSTTGRASLGGIFSLARLRGNSEPHHGSGQAPGTPISMDSQSNSLQLPREPIIVPEREDGESPARYLIRLEDNIRRGLIATVLSQSNDEFFKNVLRSYMRGFKFFGEPLDMSIRKLLMIMELPKETQQIDRVLQAFANRYHECNPGVYCSPDEAYFIAFSIIILHTDIFNKNNKHKMQKQDYTKNTRDQDVANEILECFYDNIAYTPFIQVDDAIDVNGEPKSTSKTRKGVFSRGSTDTVRRTAREPVDPYTLILDNNLDFLRPSVKESMDLDDPYHYCTTPGEIDIADVHTNFFKSGILQIVSSRSRPDAFKTPETVANPLEAHAGVVDIKTAKVGILWRKDPKKKKARSPWQEWGAILTSSQLYFFRNVAWIKTLMHQQQDHEKKHKGHVACTFKPPLEHFKPDVLMSTEHAVALTDSSYKKHKNAFTFIRHGGFEEVFLADNEAEYPDWLIKLNYAAAFRTAGVRMRALLPAVGDKKVSDVQRVDSGTSARSMHSPVSTHSTTGGEISSEFAQQIRSARRQLLGVKISAADEKLGAANRQLDSQMRNARHLQILAPIQNKTREQIILTAGSMAAKIKWLRQDIWRTRCHRDLLALDLEEDLKTPLARLPRNESAISPASRPINATKRTTSNRNSLVLTSSSPIMKPRPESVIQASIRSPSGDGAEEELVPRSSAQSSSKSALRPQAPWELAPLSLDFKRLSDMTSSIRDSSASANHTLEHEPSLNSINDSNDAPSLADVAARLATPAPSGDVDEQSILKEAGLSLTDTPSPSSQRPESVRVDTDRRSASDMPKSPESYTKDHKTTIRRSLQRTLRDSQLSHHSRHRKGKDSGSSNAMTEDTISTADNSEGLTRGTGSFIVHGKKASVVTFGSEWQNMTPEERMKHQQQRRSVLSDGDNSNNPRLSVQTVTEDETRSTRSINGNPLDRRPISRPSITTSESTAATTRSMSMLEGMNEGATVENSDAEVATPGEDIVLPRRRLTLRRHSVAVA